MLLSQKKVFKYELTVEMNVMWNLENMLETGNMITTPCSPFDA